jgi:ABC-type Na+ efflux pump permease subunit
MGLNYVFPVFFLLIPIMTSSIIGASSFVGEKEHKTMESLLYTPISIRELFFAKVVGSAVPAFVITLLSSVMFGIVMNIGGFIYFGNLVFPNFKWLILIFWVSPAAPYWLYILWCLYRQKQIHSRKPSNECFYYHTRHIPVDGANDWIVYPE